MTYTSRLLQDSKTSWSPNSASGAGKPSRRSSPKFADVAACLQPALQRAREYQLPYADDTWSPLSDITLALLLNRAGIHCRYVPLHGVVELVTPPICGRHLMLIDRDQMPGEKRFAARHGLGHVLAGHVDEPTFAPGEREWWGLEESVADAFAIADLFPDRLLNEVRAAGYIPDERRRWMYIELRRYVPHWPPERVRDRIRQRFVAWEASRREGELK